MGLLRPDIEEEEKEQCRSNVAGNTSNSCRSFSRQGKRVQLKPDDEMKRKHDDFDSRPRTDIKPGGGGGGGGGVWEYPPPLSTNTKVIVGFESPPAPEHGFAAGKGGGSRNAAGSNSSSNRRKISPLADILSDPNNDGLLHYTSDDNNSSGKDAKETTVTGTAPPEEQQQHPSKAKHKCLHEFSRRGGGSTPVPIPGACDVHHFGRGGEDGANTKRREDATTKSWDSPTKKKSVSQLLTLSPLGRRGGNTEVWETKTMMRSRSMSFDDDYEFKDVKLILQDASAGACLKNGLATRRSLVGSFEESLLSGRFLAGKTCQKLDGFLALLSVTGGSWSPQMRKLPFSVSCVDGDSCLLYYASIDIIDPKAKLKQVNTCTNEETRTWKGSRFRVPIRGRVQLVVSNPEKTPVHTFICGYDLTDMPPGTKTFMRQKLSLASNVGSNKPRSITPASTTDDISSVRRLSNGKGGILRDDRSSSKDLEVVEDRIGILSSNCCRTNIGKDRTAQSTTNKHRQVLLQQKHQRQEKPTFQEPQEKARGISIKQQDGKSGRDPFGEPGNVTSFQQQGTVLRYALHLRFMCAPLKKQDEEHDGEDESRSKTGKPVAAPDKRRFYLYGDLRVVFPQRQSDSDEGKMKVEYDFPSDPKYFEYM